MADTQPPPSYESIYGKVQAALGDKPTDAVLDRVMSGLTAEEKKILSDGGGTATDEQKKKMAEEFQKYVGSEEAKRRMALSADQAAQASKNISLSFQTLIAKVTEVDNKNLSSTKFSPILQGIYSHFIKSIATSVAFATSTATYASNWEDVILATILNEKLPIPVKQAVLEAHIKIAEGLQAQATNLQIDFISIGTELAKLQGDFATLGDETKKKNVEEISKLILEISGLTDEIAELNKKLLDTAIAGSVLSLASWCLGPFGILGTIIGGGITLGLCLKFAAQIKLKQEQKKIKEDHMKDLQQQNELITHTAAELVELGKKNLTTFNDNAAVILNVFQYAANDAVKVQDQLKAMDPMVPFISYDAMKTIILGQIGYTSGIYTTMATYLSRYADGVTQAGLHT